MSPRPRIFDILAASDEPAACQALAAGLPHVEAELQCQIIDILLARGNDASLAALPESYDRLAPQAQAKVTAHIARLFGTLPSTVRSATLQTRLNSLTLIRRSHNPRLAYLATAAIHDGSHQIRAEAAATLRDLTELHCRRFSETATLLRDACEGDELIRLPAVATLRLLREEHQQIIAAIRETVDRFESHHRSEILESAMYLADELEDGLFHGSSPRRGKLTSAMLDAFTATPSPRMAAFAYIALGYPELRRKVVQILGKLRDLPFFTAFIRHHWLARDPRIKRNLTALRALAWLGDGFEAAFTLPPRVAAMAPAWITCLGLPSDQMVNLLMSFLLIDNAEANLAAIWALSNIRTPSADLALQGACEHEDPQVRRIAQWELRHRRRVVQTRTKAARANRPQEWSDLLDRAGIDEDFGALWAQFDRIPPAIGRDAGHHAVKFIPDFQTQTQIKLIAQHPADRLRALKLLCDLNVTDRFCKEVFASANDPVPEVRAAAMRALGVLGDATSRRILERAMEDASGTVQAAAIAALARMTSGRRVDLFMPKTTSSDAIVRATAVHVLLKMRNPKAAQALLSMLKDDRPDHRCSALAVVEQLRLTAVAPRVADIAQNDPEPRIARIAQHVHRRLQKPAPSSRAPQPAPPLQLIAPLAGGVAS